MKHALGELYYHLCLGEGWNVNTRFLECMNLDKRHTVIVNQTLDSSDVILYDSHMHYIAHVTHVRGVIGTVYYARFPAMNLVLYQVVP